MIRLVFSGKTMSELSTQIQAASDALKTGAQLRHAIADTATDAAIPTPISDTATATKRTRKTKEASPTHTTQELGKPQETTASATAEAPAAAQALENIPKAKLSEQLQKVAEKGGMPLVKETLKKFGANRIGDLPTTKYKEFLDECTRVLS